MDDLTPLRIARRDKIAVSLKEAAQLVPFSEAYLRKAIHRTSHNHLPARQIGDYGGKYFIMVDDLLEWIQNEGAPT